MFEATSDWSTFMEKDDSVCLEKNYRDIYEIHANGIRNFMYYRCGNLQKAEDLAHETFVRLWENCKKVLIGKVRSFLFTTAHRLFLNQYEHEKVVLQFEKKTESKVEKESPEFILEEKEFKGQLETAISNLPEGQRTVFLLNKIDKMTFQEIADMQGVSISAVHKKMYKAMEKLRRDLKGLRDNKI
ncbi:MAG: RNA polymerase sigma factor [Cyclobacteriaceae bacterium]